MSRPLFLSPVTPAHVQQPLILDLAIITELCSRIQYANKATDGQFESFHSVLSFKLNLVWLWSENFPGSIPLTPFKRYIDHNQLHNDYYFMAYPGSTIRDVQNALATTRAFDALTTCLDASDELFQLAFRDFLAKTQNRLGGHGHAGPEMT